MPYLLLIRRENRKTLSLESAPVAARLNRVKILCARFRGANSRYFANFDYHACVRARVGDLKVITTCRLLKANHLHDCTLHRHSRDVDEDCPTRRSFPLLSRARTLIYELFLLFKELISRDFIDSSHSIIALNRLESALGANTLR